jgi:hypothetical protein
VIDRELLTSQVEAFRLADSALVTVTSFGAPASLPLTLSGKGPKVASTFGPAQAPLEGGDPAAAPASPRRAALEPSGDQEAQRSAALAAVEPDDPEGTLSADPSSVRSSGGVRWYWWVIGGAVVAGAAAGTVYGVTQATKPVTGTVSASW